MKIRASIPPPPQKKINKTQMKIKSLNEKNGLKDRFVSSVLLIKHSCEHYQSCCETYKAKYPSQTKYLYHNRLRFIMAPQYR
jgi:hypothetical protein